MPEHDFLDSSNNPYDKGGSSVKNKAGDLARKIFQLPNKGADRLAENTQAIPGSEEYLSQNKVSRRKFLQTIAALGTSIPIAVLIAKFVEWSGVIGAYQRTTSEDPRKKEQEVQSREIQDLLLFNGPSSQTGGIRGFAKDLAIIASRSRNANDQQVDFINRSTWSNSELETYFQTLDRFSNDISNQDGRNRIRNYISTTQSQYAGEYLGYIDHFENYLKTNNLPANAQEIHLRSFFTAPAINGGLGYGVNEANLFFDALNGYRKNSFSVDFKQRINQTNQKNGLQLRIP